MSEPLSPTDKVRLAKEISDGVKRYIAIQNGLLKFSFAKALGFRSSDPTAAANAASDLRGELSPLLDQLRAHELSDQFSITLRGYLRQLLQAMDVFLALCGRLAEARATKDKAYLRKGGFKADLEKLQEAERAYLVLGAKLNELAAAEGLRKKN